MGFRKTVQEVSVMPRSCESHAAVLRFLGRRIDRSLSCGRTEHNRMELAAGVRFMYNLADDADRQGRVTLEATDQLVEYFSSIEPKLEEMVAGP
jgi:hypothetical protein